MKTSFIDAQVIIIENSRQLPGDGTLDGVNVELFTGNDHEARLHSAVGGRSVTLANGIWSRRPRKHLRRCCQTLGG
ncbi:MAG: hypothetical protein R3F43_27330 [bacterium]